MNNLRNFKKQVRRVCGDIAAECILSKHFIQGVDSEKIDALVVRLAELQEAIIARSNIGFDKTPDAFGNRAEYNKARREFMHKAFKSLNDSFIDEANKIIKEFNSLIPEKQKQINKSLAGK